MMLYALYHHALGQNYGIFYGSLFISALKFLSYCKKSIAQKVGYTQF